MTIRYADIGLNRKFICEMRALLPWMNDRIRMAFAVNQFDMQFALMGCAARDGEPTICEWLHAIGIELAYDGLYIGWYGRIK